MQRNCLLVEGTHYPYSRSRFQGLTVFYRCGKCAVQGKVPDLDDDRYFFTAEEANNAVEELASRGLILFIVIAEEGG